MKRIENKNFPHERDLYHTENIHLIECSFDGPEDGESALKESKNIKLERCFMNLRYPLWHDEEVELINVTMTDKCRAALWYTHHLKIKNSKLLGIKALRECSYVDIQDTSIESPEFGWRSKNISLTRVKIEKSEYLFFEASHLHLNEVTFIGKYSFQYVEDMEIKNSHLDTKDAFWHSKNVVVKDSVIKGEYLAWYSENLTLINCKIIGTQPLCYCKNLKLINCVMEQTDLAFEYSSVEATIQGSILSVKNPKDGFIEADQIEEVIITEDAVYKNNCQINVKHKIKVIA